MRTPKLSNIGPGQYLDGRLVLLTWVQILMLLRGKWGSSVKSGPTSTCGCNSVNLSSSIYNNNNSQLKIFIMSVKRDFGANSIKGFVNIQ